MTPEKRSPAPALQSENGRAEGNHNENFISISMSESEANFAAIVLERSYRLSPLLARTIAVLAFIGGRCA